MDKKQALKQTVNSIGWKFVEEILYDEMIIKSLDFNSEGKTDQELARMVVGQELASKGARKALNKIKSLAGEEEVKETYR